ncbi:hypothetical protein OG497_37740 [Streptomyces sp. NBC_01242]|uniref:hypothetical protein n=1 Tax=Streptomyces sp. NBC_01242 TaxID=2903795 RepID=UPI00225AB1EA|nr:hypothetical protein [Streptomyces sp. NBC_01242]MCX4799601.1 hypothetical protein [Streptomyces sp. NBC_01242]
MSQQSDIKVVRLGAMIRLTHARPDGGQLQMSLTRGEKRTTSIYAVTDAEGRLRVMSARSWANQGDAPELAAEMRKALEQADA